MFQHLLDVITPSKGRSLAAAFIRLGWMGFWLQVVFGSLPIIGVCYFLVFAHPDPEAASGIGIVEYLTGVNVLILLFTTFWSYRYTRIGRRMRDPAQSPPESYLVKTVWIGVLATTIGMLFSMIVILFDTASLLFYFLKSPQAGIPVIQTSGSAASYWVSTFDIASLMALVLFLFAELIVLVSSLWLLFRATLGTPDAPQSPVHPTEIGTGATPSLNTR
jgi:hypothetical protein